MKILIHQIYAAFPIRVYSAGLIAISIPADQDKQPELQVQTQQTSSSANSSSMMF